MKNFIFLCFVLSLNLAFGQDETSNSPEIKENPTTEKEDVKEVDATETTTPDPSESPQEEDIPANMKKVKISWDVIPRISTYQILVRAPDKSFQKLMKSDKPLVEVIIPLNKELYTALRFKLEKTSRWSEKEYLVLNDIEEGKDRYHFSFKWQKPDGSLSYGNPPEELFKKEEKEEMSAPSDSHYSLFYSFSTGTLDESSVVQSGSISEDQNSPLTLGLFYGKPLGPLSAFSSSVYFSYFSDVKHAGDNSTKTPPLEYGFNSYYERKVSWFNEFFLYGGIDYEHLSTFNTDELILASNEIQFREQNLGYLTAGVRKDFMLWKKHLLFKLSLSQVVLNSGDDNPLNGEGYSGMKYIFFISYNIFHSWSVSAFYKQHLLDGAGDLTITRYGLGIGYNF
ncbi:MAG: hypothetical protein H6621_01820 [Halobacteriovoraceae bacterium]|nr:hypothetical protein [Halobacteriovoraceae bacterium]MCB9093779.1 hypothetical protein [Halobacteriovoraceae bacterium]